MALTTAQIQNAYVAFFNRPADVAGLTYWSSYAGSSGDLLNTFAKSAEYNALYAGLNNTQLVNAVYQNLFGRAPDPAGLTYWVTQLDTGKVTIGNAANTIQTGAQGSDKTIIDNKVAAATAFTTALDTTAEIVGYAGASSALLGQVKSWLSGVTADSASLEAAKTALQALTDTIKGGTNEAGATYVLKTEQDVLTGSNGDDFFRAVVGKQEGTQDQTTLNSSDIIDGGAGSDTLIVNMTGNYGGSARIKGIETLQLGSNVAGPVAVNFDYNVNAGANEVNDVNTVVYDQITMGETLNVINVTPTAKGGVIPTLVWANELNSVAGTIGVTYRQASIAGDASKPDNQNIVLKNVNNGQINIARGIETITIESAGDIAANTLVTSTGFDGNWADLVSETALGNGVNDDSTLTKVIVKGEKAFGKVATVNTNDAAGETGYGLTNRTNNGAFDTGNSVDAASASNLVSVAATVKEINAADANGGVAMRFTSRVDGNAVDVTFTGGKGADYIEFQRGNVSAAGGDGADTFAFVNSTLTNFDFGSADTITGGAGSDTIQLGVNGVGTVVANTTEFNNKTGIDVLDLRGQSNTVTLADAFVAGADAGTFTVRTDKIVQTSATSTANTAPSNATNNAAREDASVNTIVLTELADNRAIEFIGGSGSDRVVVDNASANQFTKLDGGTNAAAGSNDSLTVVNTSVLDANDVANIKGFEFLNLVESTTTNSRFDITISEAFLLANSTTAKALTIGSVANTYGNALTGADQVFLEVGDLFTSSAATAVKASLAGRVVNVQNLQVTNGLTPTYMINGVQASAAQLAVLTNAGVINATTVADANVLDDVMGAAAAAAAAVPVTLTAASNLTGTAAAEAYNSTVAILAAATVNGAGGTDTLNVTDAGAVTLTANFTNLDVLNLANGTNTITGAAAAGFTTVNGGTGVDTLVLAAGNNISAWTLSSIEAIQLAGAATMTIAQHNNTILTGATGATNLTLTDAGTVNAAAPAIAQQYVLASGANTFNASTTAGTVSVTAAAGTTSATFNFGATLNAADVITGNATGTTDTLNISGNGTSTTDGNLVNVEIINITGNAASVTLDLTGQTEGFTINASGRGDAITGGTGVDTIVGGAGVDIITGGTGADRITTGTGADIVILGDEGAGNGIDTITDFTAGAGGDIIRISEAVNAVAGANTLAFISGTAAQVAGAGAGLGANGNNINVAVLTDVGYASEAAAWNAINTATTIAESEGTFLVFFNSTTNRAEVWYDADLTSQAGGVQLATLDNIVTLAGVQTLIGTNFSVVA